MGLPFKPLYLPKSSHTKLCLICLRRRLKGGPIGRSLAIVTPPAGNFAFAVPFALPFFLAFLPVPLAVAADAFNFGCASSSLPLSSGLPPEGVTSRLFLLIGVLSPVAGLDAAFSMDAGAGASALSSTVSVAVRRLLLEMTTLRGGRDLRTRRSGLKESTVWISVAGEVPQSPLHRAA